MGQGAFCCIRSVPSLSPWWLHTGWLHPDCMSALTLSPASIYCVQAGHFFFLPSFPFLQSDKARLSDPPPCSHSEDTEMYSFAVVSFKKKESMSCHVFLPLFLTSVLLAYLSHVLSRCGGKWMMDLSTGAWWAIASTGSLWGKQGSCVYMNKRCSVSHSKEHGWTSE